VSRQVLDELKQQIPLLDYLQAHDWRPARTLSRGRVMGLCPLHEDHNRVFWWILSRTCSTAMAVAAAAT
jgi:hypothetical protein